MKTSEFEKSVKIVEEIYSTNGCRLEKKYSSEDGEIYCEIEAYHGVRLFDVIYIQEKGDIDTRSAYYQNASDMRKAYRKTQRMSCNKLIDWYEKK